MVYHAHQESADWLVHNPISRYICKFNIVPQSFSIYIGVRRNEMKNPDRTDPESPDIQVNIRNTFLEVGARRSVDYRRNNTVPIHLLLSESTDASPVTKPENQIKIEMPSAIIWIDDRAFKESSSSMKTDLARRSCVGQVKCYKSVDKFMRAYDKKVAAAMHSHMSKDSIVIVIQRRHYDELITAVGKSGLVSAIIVELDSPDASELPVTDRVFPCASWDNVLRILERMSHD